MPEETLPEEALDEPAPKLAGILTFPPEVVAALDAYCAVEGLKRDRAICEIVAESLRVKGYLRRRAPHERAARDETSDTPD